MTVQVQPSASLLQQARLAQWLTVGWMVIEGAVAIGAGLVAHSVALTAFGVDSGIELFSSVVVLRRLLQRSEREERGSMTGGERGATKLLQATDIRPGTVSYLGEAWGIKQTGYRDSIAVRTPDENEMRFFKLPTDGRIPVFEIFRVGYSQGGERLRLTITVYPADRNRFLIKVGDVPVTE